MSVDCSAKEQKVKGTNNDIEISSNKKEIVNDILYDDGNNISTRSVNLPTRGLNLGTQSYKATIVEAVQRWVYTNVYFKVGTNKRIVVKYSFTSSNGDVADIGIYDMTSGNWVAQTSGLNNTWTVNNLNTSHKYVVAFKGHTNALRVTKIHGTAIITN